MSTVAELPPSILCRETFAESRFAELPSICSGRGYVLKHLTVASADFVAGTNLFKLRNHMAFAVTAFCLTPSPDRLLRLAAERNNGLNVMGWCRQDSLVLCHPIGATPLKQVIESMVREIDQFSRRLRLHGIWES